MKKWIKEFYIELLLIMKNYFEIPELTFNQKQLQSVFENNQNEWAVYGTHKDKSLHTQYVSLDNDVIKIWEYSEELAKSLGLEEMSFKQIFKCEYWLAIDIIEEEIKEYNKNVL